jgi:hypothetical protein
MWRFQVNTVCLLVGHPVGGSESRIGRTSRTTMTPQVFWKSQDQGCECGFVLNCDLDVFFNLGTGPRPHDKRKTYMGIWRFETAAP